MSTTPAGAFTVSAGKPTATSVRLWLSVPSDSSPHVKSYKVFYKKPEAWRLFFSPEWELAGKVAAKSSCRVTDLDAGTLYTFRVVAVMVNGKPGMEAESGTVRTVKDAETALREHLDQDEAVNPTCEAPGAGNTATAGGTLAGIDTAAAGATGAPGTTAAATATATAAPDAANSTNTDESKSEAVSPQQPSVATASQGQGSPRTLMLEAVMRDVADIKQSMSAPAWQQQAPAQAAIIQRARESRPPSSGVGGSSDGQDNGATDDAAAGPLASGGMAMAPHNDNGSAASWSGGDDRHPGDSDDDADNRSTDAAAHAVSEGPGLHGVGAPGSNYDPIVLSSDDESSDDEDDLSAAAAYPARTATTATTSRHRRRNISRGDKRKRSERPLESDEERWCGSSAGNKKGCTSKVGGFRQRAVGSGLGSRSTVAPQYMLSDSDEE